MIKIHKLKPLILTALVSSCVTLGLQEKSQAVQIQLNDIFTEETDSSANDTGCATIETSSLTPCTFQENSPKSVENQNSGNSLDYLGVFDEQVLAIVNTETDKLIAILNYETKDPDLKIDFDFSGFDSGMKNFEVWELVLGGSTPPIIMEGVFMGHLPPEDLNMLADQLGVYSMPLSAFGDVDFSKKGLNFGVTSFSEPVLQLNHTEIPEPTSVVSIVGIGVLGAFASCRKKKN